MPNTSHGCRSCRPPSPPKYVPLDVLTSILLYSFDSAEIPAPKPGIIPAPWSLSQVCSSWRGFVLGEPRFWRRISFNGSNRVISVLNEVLKRSGKLELDFQASDVFFPKKGDMVAKVILPLAKSGRLRYLSLNITPQRMKGFLSLPVGSLGALAEVALTTDKFEKMRPEDIHVFDNAKGLRKITFETDGYETSLFPSFPLPLNWPWPQLTSLNFRTLYMNVQVAHEIFNLCPNLREVYVLLDDDGTDRETVEPERLATLPDHPPSSIPLPNLRTIAVEKSNGLPTEFLRPLDCPRLEQFDFRFREQRPDEWSPTKLVDLLARSTALKSVKVTFPGEIDIGLLGGDLPILTDIQASKGILSESAIESMARGELLPKLRFLSCTVVHDHLNAMINVLKVRWSQGAKQESNGVLGMRSTIIRVMGSDWQFKKEISRKICDIQKDLGVKGAVEVELCHGPKVANQDPVAGTDEDDELDDKPVVEGVFVGKSSC